MKREFSPAARLELLEATQWYLDQGGPAVVELFNWAVDRAIQLLAFMAGIGSPNTLSVRTWPLKDLPHTLVYRVLDDTLTVVAVAHQNQAPGYWQGRALPFKNLQ